MNTTTPKPHSDAGGKPRRTPTVSRVFDNGQLLEMIYRPEERRTAFVLWDGETTQEVPVFQLDPSHILVPYSPMNTLVQHGVIVFPSEATEYGSEQALVAEVRGFLHRYVDVSPLFEQVATYYVLLTWVHDRFNELPYLRLRGDPGSGKTRFLLTVGSLCYKPIFASGASTVSPLFRMLDLFRGTLILDEADFRLSDEKAEVVKILNNGNARGFPVLRSEVNPRKEYSPRAYQVFGPKLVATRGPFEDRALESRCLTEEMGTSPLRDGIPISLTDTYREEARNLRNKLLLFRFRNLRRPRLEVNDIDPRIEPRLRQIFLPLLGVIDDPQVRDQLAELAVRYHHDLVTERAMDTEAQVLQVVQDILESGAEPQLSIKEITAWFSDRHSADYERKITAKWIGWVVRQRLHLRTERRSGLFVIPAGEYPKLTRLYERYGVSADDRHSAGEAVDVPKS